VIINALATGADMFFGADIGVLKFVIPAAVTGFAVAFTAVVAGKNKPE